MKKIACGFFCLVSLTLGLTFACCDGKNRQTDVPSPADEADVC